MEYFDNLVLVMSGGDDFLNFNFPSKLPFAINMTTNTRMISKMMMKMMITGISKMKMMIAGDPAGGEQLCLLRL